MKTPTLEELRKSFPRLSPEMLYALWALICLYPEISSFPDKRLEYEAINIARDHLRTKNPGVLCSAANELATCARKAIPVHKVRNDAHPLGGEAYLEGEELRSNPFPRSMSDDRATWKREWLKASLKKD